MNLLENISARSVEAEWNFDTVPDAELVACCYWEYARESSFISNTLQMYREWYLAGGKWNDGVGEIDERLRRIRSIGYPSEVFVRGCAFRSKMICQSTDPHKSNYRHPDAPPITGSFPAPWQSLSAAERKYRAHIRSYAKQMHIVPIKMSHWSWAKGIARECQSVADTRHEDRKKWEAKYLSGGKNGSLSLAHNAPPAPEFEEIRPRTRWGVGETLMVDIAWECFTNDEIANYFRQWLKVARPTETPSPSSRGHKPGDWRAQLTRLSVMRLLSKFSAGQIVKDEKFPVIWKTKQFSASKWSDVTKWHDARREAGRIFKSLFPFLPKDEKPLSWSRR